MSMTMSTMVASAAVRMIGSPELSCSTIARAARSLPIVTGYRSGPLLRWRIGAHPQPDRRRACPFLGDRPVVGAGRERVLIELATAIQRQDLAGRWPHPLPDIATQVGDPERTV